MEKSYPDVVQNGPLVYPIDRIKLYSAGEWEKFIEEWVDCIKVIEGYIKVERLGGAGDMGSDIIATVDTSGLWDNYQCKHYASPLSPSDVWVEFGKMVYHSFKKEITYPRRYFFVAPQGVGTKLANLLKDGEKLKAELITNWDKYCKAHISVNEIILDDNLLKHLEALNFSIYSSVTPLTIINQFKRSSNYSVRFGGGLPERPDVSPPPDSYQDNESVYLKKLFEAYSDHLECDIKSFKNLKEESLRRHFIRSRKEFFSAEALRLFSRDSLPVGEYERLQTQFLDGIADELDGIHDDGFHKVKEVVKVARELQVTNHALVTRMETADRGGICHQLANEKDDVRWVNHE